MRKEKENRFACYFCGGMFLRCELERAHYPTPKSQGGKSIVLACINCHNFQHIVEDNFSILDKYGTQGHREEFTKNHPQSNFFGIFKINQPK